MMRDLGLPYKVIEENGYMMPLISSHLEYKKSAYYDELLEVETRVENPPIARVHLDYTIRKVETKEIVVEGYTELVFIKSDTNKITRAPKFFLDKFRTIFDKKN